MNEQQYHETAADNVGLNFGDHAQLTVGLTR